MSERVLIIDGSALIHRAYHALPPFTAADGTPTNAVYGFISMLHHLIEMLHPTHIAVCMDTPKPTFRKELLKTYQAQRPKAPDELKVQFPLVKEFLEKAGIIVLLKEGFEADDVIGTLTHHLQTTQPNWRLYVVTGDRDLLQLVTQNVSVMMPKSGVSNIVDYGPLQVKEYLGIYPQQVVDYKALVGDSSDNYGGIPGIGPKTARDLLANYETLEGIYAHLSDVSARTRQLLEAHKKSALLSKKLATISLDVPVEISSSAMAFNGFHAEMVPFLERYGLKSIRQRLEKKEKDSVPSKKDDDQLSFF